MNSQKTRRANPLKLAVLANRFESTISDMTRIVLRTARSSVINTAKDFSCTIVTSDHALLASTEGLPAHIIGSDLLSRSMFRLQSEIVEGDAFLHNDPYDGNTHAADHTIIVPVFYEGEHRFSVLVKAHQADCGNALPTTYSATAKDVYNEGALIFPCVKVQKDYEDVIDIIRMCQARIRVPEQWYGDYLAMLGAARAGEKAIKGLLDEYGGDEIAHFVDEWFDYSERLMDNAISQIPSGSQTASSTHDPVPALEEGFTFNATVSVGSEAGHIEIDLRDNPDNYPGGMNASEATAQAAAVSGVFLSIPQAIPVNAGSLRRISVLLRDGSMAGRPQFPYSASVATTEPFDHLVACVTRAFSYLGQGYGAADGALGQPPFRGVISGDFASSQEAAFVSQIFVGSAGGPANALIDGWPTYARSSSAGAIYHDSVELDELRYPFEVESLRLIPDSGGPGLFRGGQGTETVLRVKGTPAVFSYMVNGYYNPPRGVLGGDSGSKSEAALFDLDGTEIPVGKVAMVEVQPGQRIFGRSNGGGGYGNPYQRSPELVLEDVLENRVSERKAKEDYGVVIANGQIDEIQTQLLRQELGLSENKTEDRNE